MHVETHCLPPGHPSHRRAPVIPPKTGAAITPPPKEKDPPATRGDAVRRICEIGAKAWKVETGYHRRSLAETAMARYKAILGPNLKSRTRDTQITEAAVAVRCVNTSTDLGMHPTESPNATGFPVAPDRLRPKRCKRWITPVRILTRYSQFRPRFLASWKPAGPLTGPGWW